MKHTARLLSLGLIVVAIGCSEPPPPAPVAPVVPTEAPAAKKSVTPNPTGPSGIAP